MAKQIAARPSSAERDVERWFNSVRVHTPEYSTDAIGLTKRALRHEASRARIRGQRWEPSVASRSGARRTGNNPGHLANAPARTIPRQQRSASRSLRYFAVASRAGVAMMRAAQPIAVALYRTCSQEQQCRKQIPARYGIMDVDAGRDPNLRRPKGRAPPRRQRLAVLQRNGEIRGSTESVAPCGLVNVAPSRGHSLCVHRAD
jgi:hypothetical protein